MSKIQELPYSKIETSSDITKVVKSNKVIEENVNEILKNFNHAKVLESIKDLTDFSNSLKKIYALTKGYETNIEIINVIGRYQTLINNYNIGCHHFLQKIIDCMEDVDFSINMAKENIKQSVSMINNSSYSANLLVKECSKLIDYSEKIHEMCSKVLQELTKTIKNKNELSSNEILKKYDDHDLINSFLNSNSIIESSKLLKSFWEKVSQKCRVLTDTNNINGLSTRIEGEDGLINFINAIKLISYIWLSLGYMIQSLSAPLLQVKEIIDKFMSNLPDSCKSIEIVKNTCSNLKSSETTTAPSTSTKVTTDPIQ